MIGAESTFVETLSSATRKTLVSERIAAMRGRLREVCAALKTLIAATPSDKHSDLVSLGLLWSEVLHLSGQDAEALSVFKEVVEPRQAFLSTATQLVAADNLFVLQIGESPREGITSFYHLLDRRRVAQFEVTEWRALIVAQSAVDTDRFTEAIPLLWQNLLRAYTAGSWRESRWAAERLGNLYHKAGDLEHACHYFIVAEADKEMERLADATARRGDPAIIRSILRRLTEFANLRRHFTVACKFIAKIPDLIPDVDIENLAEWMLPRCREPANVNHGGAMRAAWEAIRELGHRVTPATSRRLIEAAVSHPEWQAPPPGENRFLPNRKVMVEAVTFLAHSAPKDYLPELAADALLLATERVQDHDYDRVVNLLCNLSVLGGDSLRDSIRTALYVPGKPVNRILAQLAGFFKVEALDTTRWEAFANKVVEETLLTVQWLKSDEVAKPVAETLMRMTHTTPTGQLQIAVHGAVGLEALARGKEHLSDATIERIVRVLVEMATNRDNLLSNRELLLSQLCGFADRTQTVLRDEVVRTLEPLTRGIVTESADYPNSASGRNPRAPARMNMGTPEQVQAMAMVAAATLCGADTTRFRLIGEALVEGFVSPHVVVRRGAYAAARRLPKLSGEQLLPILMGLRDPDPEAAVTAFAAFAERKEWSLTRPMWKLFFLATRLATQSPDSNLRRNAALALRARFEDAPTEAIRSDARAIIATFSRDVAYSVRETVTI